MPSSSIPNDSGDRGLQILVHLGRQEAIGHTGFGLALVERLHACRHQVCAVLLKAGDALAPLLRAQGIAVVELLPELCGSRNRIRRCFEDPAFAPRRQAWLDKVRALAPELGLVFYSDWLPPALYTLPHRGCVNFHPAPLPRLRGYEPETFAILEGWTSISGSFHKVDEHFDTGPLLWRTRDISIQPAHRPADVLHGLSWAALEALPAFLDSLQRNKIEPIPQDPGQASYATVKRALQESYIQWSHDTLDKIHLRNRAFNHQENFFRLKAEVAGRIHLVHAISRLDDRRHAAPGSVLGRYPHAGAFRGQPVLQAVDGSLVLRLSARGLAAKEAARIRSVKEEYVMFAEKPDGSPE